MAGAVAGSATVLITNPIWVVNTRMTARKRESADEKGQVEKTPSTIGTLVKMLREEGPTSLFAGVMPALVLVINPILQYTVYEQLKNMVERRRKVGPTDSFYLGAIGKLIATGVTYPYLTVKSRAHVAGKDGSKENMFTSFNRILKEEGWSGLYGGKMSLPNVIPFHVADTAQALARRSYRALSPQHFYLPLRTSSSIAL